MNSLKVGDKFLDSEGELIEVLAVTSKRIIYKHLGMENGWDIQSFLDQFTPYQEPVPVKRIVAFKSKVSNEIKFAQVENAEGCKFFQTREWERIELSPEMFMGAK